MWTDLFIFSGLMALGQMVPGPDWVLVTRHALRDGVRRAAWVATGIACGLIVHATLALGGLGYLLTRESWVWRMMSWLAAGFLVWMAVMIWRGPSRQKLGELSGCEPGPATAGRPFLQGLFCNLLNPKVPMVLISISAPFLEKQHGTGWIAALWLVIVLQGWLIWVAWAAFLQRRFVRAIHTRYSKWLERGFALLLIVMALKLAAG